MTAKKEPSDAPQEFHSIIIPSQQLERAEFDRDGTNDIEQAQNASEDAETALNAKTAALPSPEEESKQQKAELNKKVTIFEKLGNLQKKKIDLQVLRSKVIDMNLSQRDEKPITRTRNYIQHDKAMNSSDQPAITNTTEPVLKMKKGPTDQAFRQKQKYNTISS